MLFSLLTKEGDRAANSNCNTDGGGVQFEYRDGYLLDEAFGDEKPFSVIK